MIRNPLLNIPLRYLIPILLGVFVLGIQALFFQTHKTLAFAGVRNDAVSDVRNQLNRAQNIIELLHKDATLLQIRTLVASFGADAGHELMVLTDNTGMVLASTSVKLLNKTAALPENAPDIAAIKSITASGGVEVFLSEEGHKVNGYAAVCGLSTSDHLRLNNCGVMYLRNDISTALLAASNTLMESAIRDGLGIIILGLVFWMVIHFSLTRRAQGLINATQQFSRGNSRARAKLEGRDELAVVGQAVDRMLDQIVHDTKALESSEEQLRRVFESVADGIIAYDSYGVVRAFNSSCEAIFFQARDSIIGQPLNNLIAPSKRKFFERSQPRDGVMETIGVRPDGSEFDMEMSLSEMPVQGEIQTIAIVRDVTERKRLDSLKSEFISVVSHELRTPITSIQGALGLIKGGAAGDFPESLHTMIDMCKRNSDRLLNLINDILDMDKIASGKMEFNFTTVSTTEIINEAAEVNQPYAEAHGVKFEVREETDTTIKADTDRLHQVFANLLSNAAKFSKPNDVITLSVEEINGTVRFSVTDTGPGIPDQFRDKIFERFIQIEDANTRKIAGTGLGLSISKSIIELHHGRIGLDTMLGQGSTFWFELPSIKNIAVLNAQKKATG